MAYNPSSLELVPRDHSQRPRVILDFPPELLLQILRHHFRSVTIDHCKSCRNPYAPIHTCKTLRGIALGDRKCWSSIEITIDFPSIIAYILTSPRMPNLDDYIERTISRLLSEVKWRLGMARDLPIDLSIRLYNQLASHQAYFSFQAIRAIDLFHRRLVRTIFGPNEMGPRINSYEEDGYRLYGQYLYGQYAYESSHSFFNDITSVMHPYQYETLTSLWLECPQLQMQLMFPNLTELAVWGYEDSLETLSKITAPALDSIHVRGLRNYLLRIGSAPEIHYLAPLIARFPKLRSADLSGIFLTNVFPPQGPAGCEHPSIIALNISDERCRHGSLQCFSSFSTAFPILRTVTMDLTMTSPTDGGITESAGTNDNGSLDAEVMNIPRAINVTKLGFIRAQNVDTTLIRVATKAFPNLKRLEFGSHHPPVEGRPDRFIHGGEIFGLLPQYFPPGSRENLQEGWPHLSTIILRSTLFDKAGFLAWLGFLQTSFACLVMAGSCGVQPRVVIEDCSLYWGEFLCDESEVPICQLPALDSNMSWIKFRLALEEVLMDSLCLSAEAIAKETGGLLGASDN